MVKFEYVFVVCLNDVLVGLLSFGLGSFLVPSRPSDQPVKAIIFIFTAFLTFNSFSLLVRPFVLVILQNFDHATILRIYMTVKLLGLQVRG